jgi:hypothetical protein
MSKILSDLLLVVLTAEVVGCGDSGSATGPAGPSAAGAVNAPSTNPIASSLNPRDPVANAIHSP